MQPHASYGGGQYQDPNAYGQQHQQQPFNGGNQNPQQQQQQQGPGQGYAPNTNYPPGGAPMYNPQQPQQQGVYGAQNPSMMSPDQSLPNASLPPHQQMQMSGSANPPPAAPMATDENGLRWTWSSFPLTPKPKQSALANLKPANFISGVSSEASGHSNLSANSHHPLPIPEEMVIPLAAMYTPLHPSHEVVRTGRPPCPCRQCGAYLSKVAQIDFVSNYWACPSCLTRNALPNGFGPNDPSIRGSTVEYNCGVPDPSCKQVFIFTIDTAVEADELDALRKQLLRAVDMLPQDALVGCVTFGRGVTVWDLGCESLNRCYTIRGNRTFASKDSGVLSSVAGGVLSAALGAGSPTMSSVGGGAAGGSLHRVDMTTSAGYIRAMLSIHRDNPVVGRFFVPLSDCEFALTSIIEELSVDPFPVPTGLRPERATGTALDVGATLLENLVAEGVAVSAKMLLFVGGPATRGPGAVVGVHKGQMMRSHRDFLDYNVPLYEKALEFYNGVERRLSAIGGSVDCFVASFDQTGIMELRECVNRTGGVFVCGDTFVHEMFENSLQRYFFERDFAGKRSTEELQQLREQQHLQEQQQQQTGEELFPAAVSGFNATFDIFTSRETLVSGAIGPCRAYIPPSAVGSPTDPLRKPASPSSPTAASLSAQVGTATRAHLPPILETAKRISPISIGEGGTQRWVASSVDSGVTITFLFDTAVLEGGATSASIHQKQRFVQFVTHFTTPNGERRVRVCTVTHHIAPTSDPTYFNGGNPQMNPNSSAIFDQTCAATVVSRMAVAMMEDYAPHMWDTSKRWIDKLLVMFVKRFGSYRVGAPDSLRLSHTLSLFPSFMYNLRRSEYFMTMNISPDETVFKRHWLMREGCDRAVLMIQPTLHSYTFAAPYATPVPLDSNSILPDNILVIDCFFNLHIIRGLTVEAWRKLDYHLNPDYQHFADLLAAPERDTAVTLASRFPYPRFSNEHIDHGEARHLKTRLNPSNTYTNPGAGGAQYGQSQNSGAVLNTDDASIAKFMQTLKDAVVRPDGAKDGKVGLSQ